MVKTVAFFIVYIVPLFFIKYSPEKRAQVEKELSERRAKNS